MATSGSCYNVSRQAVKNPTTNTKLQVNALARPFKHGSQRLTVK